MSMANSLLKQLFIESQDSSNQHDLMKRFYKLYKSADKDKFADEFISLARHPMVVYNREPCIERTVDFMSKAATHVAIKETKKKKNPAELQGAEEVVEQDEEEEDMHPLLLKFFTFLLDSHSAKERAVRFRCCQLITRLLKDMGEGAKIDDDLYDRIYRCMVERLKDKCAQVRVHAVLSLTRLQNPMDETCPIVKAYMILMTKDPNMEVRRMVLTCIAPSTITIAAILERTRDVKAAVRRTAYSVIAEKIPLRALTIQQRVDLLQCGLNDRAEPVQAICSTKLLQNWLRACQGNALELLERLDVQTSVKICGKALTELFKMSSVLELVGKFDVLNDKQMVAEEKLTCESAFYWRNVVEYVQSQGHEFDEQLDLIRPNCVEFCSYIKRFSEQLKLCTDEEKMLDMEFVMEQLLQLVCVLDLTDTHSRKAVKDLLHDLLVSDNIGPSLVSHILLCFKLVQPDTDQLVAYVAETISEIREPITLIQTKVTTEQRMNLDKKIASIRVKVNELRQELSECIEKQDFEQAARVKNDISSLDSERSSLLEESQPQMEEVRTMRNDPLTMLKCLTIVCELLISANVKKWSPQLQGLMESQILSGMVSDEAEVRNVSVRAIGLSCQVKKEMVMQHLPVLLQATQVDTPLVRTTALKAIFDIILIFGLDSLVGEEETPVTADTSSTTADGDEANTSTNSPSNTSSATTEEQVNESSIESSRKSMNDEGGKKGWSETAVKVVSILSTFLNSEIPDLRNAAAEGLAKLILSGRVMSAKLLSHLLLLWFNPLMEDDETLSQTLGAFFPLFAFSNSENQELVEEAFVPTLKMLTQAPASSPLSEVNDVNVASFLVELTDARHLVENVKANVTVQENPCHDSLAVKFCNEILSHPDSFAVRLWLRSLNQLSISPNNVALHKDLSKMTERMGSVVTEKQCIKSLERFRDDITALLEVQEQQAPLNPGESRCEPSEAAATELDEQETEEASSQDSCSANKIARRSLKTPARVKEVNTGNQSLRKSSKQDMNPSALDSSVFATPRPRGAKQKDDVEGLRQDLENLMNEHRSGKTPLASGTPKTPKRPLHTIQDPGFTEDV